MNQHRPDTAAILAQLKDFQRDTVNYVFNRLYRDSDSVRRFLVADEVGLGKTLVARGVIAKTIDHLWERTKRIDVVYVCSNTDIARQNINRLNVTGHEDFCLSSRITLLPLNLAGMQRRRLNFVSFTPGTSFELSQGSGQSLERELLYWLIANEHNVSFVKATRLLEANAGTDAFRERVQAFPERQPSPHAPIAAMFWNRLQSHPHLLNQFDELCEAMPRAGAAIPADIHQARNRLIGELRRLLAESCLHWLEPDLIILDEFQRFKHLMEYNGDDSTEAAQLAHHLFDYQQSRDDPSTGARVLLLSATPYKMYTLAQEQEQDDHYADFERTLGFLLPSQQARQDVSHAIDRYREELLRAGHGNAEGLPAIKGELETLLRRVMVRTERLATTADRNGMLAETQHAPTKLLAGDVEQYLQLQDIARSVQQEDVMDFWKSAPYLVNFMEEYELKRKLRKQIDASEQSPKFVEAISRASAGMLNRAEIERYRRLDPGNARLRALHHDTIERGAWRLLWVPPSLPYYRPAGAFADPQLANFTKRLVFSCWRVVPKAVSAVLSYEAEREMICTFRQKSRNTAEARKKRRSLLRFAFTKGRLTGMPVLGLIYPCRFLAELFDPLSGGRAAGTADGLPAFAALAEQAALEITSQLSDDLAKARAKPGPADEAWYWAAPILLDRKHHRKETERWFAQPDLADRWNGGLTSDDQKAVHGWSRHVESARDFLAGRLELGPPPEDLAITLAGLMLAGPGVSAMRALARIASTSDDEEQTEYRNASGALAHAFLHLFNLPEVMALLRDRRGETPYWKSVLTYCADGNLQAMLDEYAHVLVESLGLIGSPSAHVHQKVSEAMQGCLTLRTSTAQADLFSASKRRIQPTEPLRLRTRFAMRFGDQEVENSSEPTRADQVRQSFNSPFWPFVLTTTSVGQEGLDFHPYCHAVVHWNLPSNPVDLEQREGRVHRYKGHALRKNIATAHGHTPINGQNDVWSAMFVAACAARADEHNDLFPFWITSDGAAKIERHIPTLPLSREIPHMEQLRRSLVLYRMVFGQNRQEDLVRYLLENVTKDRVQELTELYRVSLAPPQRRTSLPI